MNKFKGKRQSIPPNVRNSFIKLYELSLTMPEALSNDPELQNMTLKINEAGKAIKEGRAWMEGGAIRWIDL